MPLEVFDATLSNLEKGMQVSTKKQTVIAHNIANANTPGFEPLRFDEILDKVVKKEGKKSVIIEEEMADLAENSIKYSAYVKLMSSKLNILKTVATQGRR